jgi:DNA polymerase I
MVPVGKNRMKIIIGLPPKLKKGQPVALDVELFRAERKRLHRVTGKFACLSICFDPKVVYLVENEKDVPKALALVKDGLWVFHNAYFDIFHLRRWVHVGDVKFWDTMLIEKELFAGYYDSFGLEDLARRWLNEEMSKEDVKLFGKADTMMPEMRRYTAHDARTTLMLQAKQAPLYPKVKNLYEKIDRPALFALLRFGGMYLDQRAWTKLATKNQLDTDEMREEFDFNPNSPKQAYEALQKSGIGHLRSTNAKHLERHQGNKMVDDLLTYRKSAKQARTYGLNILKMVEADGRIHAGFNIIGAVTGRTSSYNPNFQNIPVKDGPQFRKCFIAPRGRRLIIGDYSQQEPRINAVQAGDAKMIDLFKQGGNIYINVTKEVFGKVITKSDPLYKHMKSMILGLSYGLSEKGLAMHEKISEIEARRLIQRYLWAFPKQKRYMDRARQSSEEIITVPGGKQICLNRYAFTSANQVLDYPAQGGAANCSKRALIYVDEALRKQKLDAFIVNFVHDEILVEAPSECAKVVANLVHSCMVKAAEEIVPNVPFEADIFVGTSWADKDKKQCHIVFPKRKEPTNVRKN